MKQWLISIALAVISLAVSSYVAYSRNDKDIAQRVTAVETQQKNDGKSLDRIELKVDRTDSKIDQLLMRVK